jgi:hypothetical protein
VICATRVARAALVAYPQVIVGSTRNRHPRASARERKLRNAKRQREARRSGGRDAPSELDQVAVVIVEQDLGLETTNLAGLEAFAARLPFEPSVSLLSQLSSRAEDTMRNPVAQVKLAEAFFGSGEIVERYRTVASASPDARIFGPQSLYTLIRVLVEHAYEAPITQKLTVDERVLLMRAVVASNSAIEWGVEHELGTSDEDILAYELQAGSYYSRPRWLEEIARHRELYRLATTDPDLLASPDCEPVKEWLERSGLTAEEQWLLGFAMSSQGPTWDAQRHPHVAPETVSEILNRAGLHGRETEALALISASRAELRGAFADLQASGKRFVWELRPFNTTPYLRLNDGGLLLLGRPWMLSWLGEGFHYRAMKMAQADDANEAEGRTSHVQNYTAYTGQVFEQYCLRHARAALGERSTVLGEQAYGQRLDKLTSDVAVVWGADLILFEANARRVGAEPIVSGDPLEATKELSKLLVKKIDQLAVCIKALLAEEAQLPGIRIASVKRIWPVVVAAGHVWQTQHLWAHLDSARNAEKATVFEDPRVQPLQAFDASEFEMLLALAAHGNDLAKMLKRKVSGPYRHRDLAVWLAEDSKAPDHNVRLSGTEAVWQEMIKEAATVFGPGVGS